jgi:CubicO group peptidase (beta-lactamase class C family)
LDGAALAQAIDAAFSEPDRAHPRRTRALVVVHGDRIVAERYAEGFDAKMPLIGWSMSKTATNALVGLRVKDGKLALSNRALLPEWRRQDDSRRDITLNQLLRMTSGLRFDESYDDELSDVTQMLFVEEDAGKFAASKPLEFPPGSRWAYSSGTTNILARVLRESFENDRDYLRFPYERLFKPLGMRSAVLQPDASGTFIASSFLYASARDWARLGLYFLRKGEWRGEQLLPETWVRSSLIPIKSAPNAEYGAHLWLRLPDTAGSGEPPMPDDAYYMLGHDQQIVAIIRSRDLVIVRLGLTREGGNWDHARELAPIVAAFPRRTP